MLLSDPCIVGRVLGFAVKQFKLLNCASYLRRRPGLSTTGRILSPRALACIFVGSSSGITTPQASFQDLAVSLRCDPFAMGVTVLW